jgi:putative phosphoribosyl transferase
VPAPLAVEVPAGGAVLQGDLAVPEGSPGVVVFAHGSGSSRFSPRNRQVARRLNEAGLGTLLVDLLTGSEDEPDALTQELRFDIGLLAERLLGISTWLRSWPSTRLLKLGYFGASTGAAAALVAAAEEGDRVCAVVSRGGRPDLAGDALGRVAAPTLLIVGERDELVLRLNREAAAELRCPWRLIVVPGATHLFEEQGALERVGELAAGWFTANMA